MKVIKSGGDHIFVNIPLTFWPGRSTRRLVGVSTNESRFKCPFCCFLRENARTAALDSLTCDFLIKRKGRYFFYCRPTSRQVGALRACWLMLPGMVRERHRRRCCSRGHLNRAGGAGAVVFRTGPCLFSLGADHVRYAHHVHTS